MKRVSFVIALLLNPLFGLVASAQRDSVSKPFVRNVEFEIGYLSRYNTYLSPLLYEGTNLSFMLETLHPQKKNDNFVIAIRNKISAGIMNTTFGANGMNHFSEDIQYAIHYKLKLRDFNVLLGAGMSDNVFFDVSTVNENNQSSTGFSHSLLDLSVYPNISFKTKKRTITLSDQFVISLIRFNISENYTQSVYDAFSEELDLSANYKLSAFNYTDFSNRFTITIPLKKTTLLLSHVVEREKIAMLNNERRRLANSFAIGFSYNIIRSAGRFQNQTK